jgi:molybdopterin biosynthesis enzyme
MSLPNGLIFSFSDKGCQVSIEQPDDALQKILADDICANINVPEFDNSAMDGYAIAKTPMLHSLLVKAVILGHKCCQFFAYSYL